MSTQDSEPTPGPWDYSPQDGEAGHCICAQVWGEDGEAVATMNSNRGQAEASANAQLVAATPNLLSAAKRMLEAVKSNDPAEPGAQAPDGGAVMSLKGAIAKAEGEA